MKRALGLVALLAILASASIPTAAPAARLAPAGQDQAPTIEVGAGPIGDRAFAFTGRTEYRSDTVTLYGYLSVVIGLEPSQVFTDPTAASAATARFTYTGEATITARGERNGVTEITGEGTLNIYVAGAAGADFADPTSFAAGEIVATMTISVRDELQRPTPGLGVVVGDAEASQTVARSFTLGSDRYRFGHLNARERLHSVGGEGRSEGEVITMSVEGTSVVTYRDPHPKGTADATPVSLPECLGIESWLADTKERLARAAAITAGIPADGPAASLDAAALGKSAAEAETLLQAQREAEAPPAGQNANRLISSAFSRTAQGLRLLADAAAGNESSLAAGRLAIADGTTLAARATNELAAIATVCGIAP